MIYIPNKSLFWNFGDINYNPIVEGVARRGQGASVKGVQLTLLQPGGSDYAHHITACPPPTVLPNGG